MKAEPLDLVKLSLEYDPKAVDCTSMNIDLLTEFCKECEIPLDSPKYQDVKKLLEAASTSSTEEHKTVGAYGNDDLHYFLDMDMVVLGSPREQYLEYSDKIRQEYSYLRDDMYLSLRVKVLQTFLQIPNIFATKFFRDRYEKQARENIQEEIALNSCC